MDNQTPETLQTANSPNESKKSHRMLSIIIVALFFGVIALAWFFLFRSATIQDPPTRPIDLPVSDQVVNSIEEIAALTDGKAIPPEFPGISLPALTSEDHVYGDREAPYSIVEYSNIGNLYAKILHPEIKALVNSSNKEINWIVRHYPLSESDYFSAQAAECAFFEEGHDAFWAYFDRAVATPPTSLEQASSLATALNLDATGFSTCLTNNYTRDIVIDHSKDGQLDAKISVSPSYVISNNTTNSVRLVEGANSVDYLEKVIRAIQ